jgi:tripartite-type tricarboxylate transporter receptor subunit TctC
MQLRARIAAPMRLYVRHRLRLNGLGFPKAGFDVATVMGLYAPARTEPRIAARLHAEAATVLREPAMTARMEQLGMIMAEDGTANYIAFTKRDDARYAAIVQKLHLQIKN